MSEEITAIRVWAEMIVRVFTATLSQTLKRIRAAHPGHSWFILNCWTSMKRTTTTWSRLLGLYLRLTLAEEELALHLNSFYSSAQSFSRPSDLIRSEGIWSVSILICVYSDLCHSGLTTIACFDSVWTIKLKLWFIQTVCHKEANQ